MPLDLPWVCSSACAGSGDRCSCTQVQPSPVRASTMVSRSKSSSSAPSTTRTVCTSWLNTASSPYSCTRRALEVQARTSKPASATHSCHIAS